LAAAQTNEAKIALIERQNAGDVQAFGNGDDEPVCGVFLEGGLSKEKARC